MILFLKIVLIPIALVASINLVGEGLRLISASSDVEVLLGVGLLSSLAATAFLIAKHILFKK